ncbi:MAG: antitoxin [Acidobacteria bacterium]|nr:antitoxin [Acidobacteriota bacterium]
MVRVQVLLTEEEREALRHRAERDGQSLSGWIREAAMGKLESVDQTTASTEELAEFFSAREDEEHGPEPDWEDHLAVIDRSRRGHS